MIATALEVLGVLMMVLGTYIVLGVTAKLLGALCRPLARMATNRLPWLRAASIRSRVASRGVSNEFDKMLNHYADH